MLSFTKQSGKWKVQVRLPGVSGSRSKSGFSTKATAREWGAREETTWKADVYKDTLVLGQTNTLEDAIKKFVEEVSPNRTCNTWEVGRAKTFFAHSKKGDIHADLPLKMPIGDILPEHIKTWVESRSKAVRAASVRREVAFLSVIFQTAKDEWKMVRTNPVREVKRPPRPRGREQIFTKDEIDRLVDSLGYRDDLPVSCLRHETAVTIMLANETMMRSNEMLTIVRDNIFLAERYIKLEKTKNGDDRNVPLSLRAIFLIEKMLKAPGRVSAAGDHLLFSLKGGTRVQYFHRAKERCKITGKRFHDTRATALTKIAKKLKGGKNKADAHDVLALAKMSGHRDPRSVMIYFREDPSDLAKLLDD